MNGNGNGNGNAYDRGDYNSFFALRAVELKMIIFRRTKKGYVSFFFLFNINCVYKLAASH